MTLALFAHGNALTQCGVPDRPPHSAFLSLPPTLPGSIFEVRTNHVSVIVRNAQERLIQVAAGLGPFTPPIFTSQRTVYCGQNITYQNWGQATPVGKAAFLEILQLHGEDNDFFKDFYELHGPSIVYIGLGLAPNVTRAQMLAHLETHNIPVLMSWPVLQGYVYIDMIRLGYVYAEVLSGYTLP